MCLRSDRYQGFVRTRGRREGNIATTRRRNEGARQTNENQVRERTVGRSPHGAGGWDWQAWPVRSHGAVRRHRSQLCGRRLFHIGRLSGSANSILALGGCDLHRFGWLHQGRSFGPRRKSTRRDLRRLTTTGTLDPVETLRGREILTTVLQPDQKIVGIARESRFFQLAGLSLPTATGRHARHRLWLRRLVALAFGGRVGSSIRPRPLLLMSPALALEPGGGITIAGRQGATF